MEGIFASCIIHPVSEVLIAQDFFKPQPERQVGYLHMRNIIHNWSTPQCLDILRHLHTAATAETRLVISDVILPYACKADPSDIPFHFEGDGLVEDPPEPLLANLGNSRLDLYILDFVMGTVLNGLERTLAQFKDLFADAGWTIEEVYQSRWDKHSHIICRKV